MCPPQVTCSQAGACAATSSKSSDQTPVVVNQSPSVALVTASGFGAIVYVKRMADYQPCQNGVTPSAESPCEPGAVASDPDGNAGGSTQDSVKNLSKEVVVCPPKSCLATGCSLATLRKHRFGVKGLAGCGVDTSAAVGTQFVVDFWVW